MPAGAGEAASIPEARCRRTRVRHHGRQAASQTGTQACRLLASARRLCFARKMYMAGRISGRQPQARSAVCQVIVRTALSAIAVLVLSGGLAHATATAGKTPGVDKGRALRPLKVDETRPKLVNDALPAKLYLDWHAEQEAEATRLGGEGGVPVPLSQEVWVVNGIPKQRLAAVHKGPFQSWG